MQSENEYIQITDKDGKVNNYKALACITVNGVDIVAYCLSDSDKETNDIYVSSILFDEDNEVYFGEVDDNQYNSMLKELKERLN